MFLEEEKKKPRKVIALEGKLFDFFTGLGERLDDLGDGGSLRGYHYEPGEVPLGIVAREIGFDVQGGWANSRVKQLAEIGLYELRVNGNGKPSFLRLLVWDHDEHFQAKAHDRIVRVAQKPPAATVSNELLNRLHHGYADDIARREALKELLMKVGRGSELTAFWAAYRKSYPYRPKNLN